MKLHHSSTNPFVNLPHNNVIVIKLRFCFREKDNTECKMRARSQF